MKLKDLTILDFETSGLKAARDRVIEMAAIRVIDGELVTQFSTLVRFEDQLPAKITEITGLTSEQLKDGMDEGNAFRILNRVIGDSVIVAHNALFDLSFFHHTLIRLAGRSFSNSFLDTLTICRTRHTYPHTLTDMCARYGIELEGAHRSLNDVIGCWKLLEKLNEEKSVEPDMNRLGYLRKYGTPEWYPEQAKLEGIELKYA
jgi:DNA polymerase-3 subunit epsilon